MHPPQPPDFQLETKPQFETLTTFISGNESPLAEQGYKPNNLTNNKLHRYIKINSTISISKRNHRHQLGQPSDTLTLNQYNLVNKNVTLGLPWLAPLDKMPVEHLLWLLHVNLASLTTWQHAVQSILCYSSLLICNVS